MDSVCQVNRNGKSGCGILIEDQQIESGSNNVSVPTQIVVLTFVSFQNGDAALTPDIGSGLYAEEVEQYILDALHLQSFGRFGTIQVEGKFSEPARDYQGISARRLTLKIKTLATKQTPRTGPVTVAINEGLATLTSQNSAKIVYTLDGSFPSDPSIAIEPINNVPVNPRAIIYTVPFTVQPGETLARRRLRARDEPRRNFESTNLNSLTH